MRFKSFIIILMLTFAMLPVARADASTQDFYFKDFTADYYLTKAEDGTSKLHVKEVLTAVFPETDQNHGINREIPIYNQGKKNRTVENEPALNLTVLRNGEPENIARIVDEGDYYNVYIGNASVYVRGEQIYTLEYDFTDVITEFDEDLNNVSGQEGVNKLFQELYWDTNGTGWSQKFESVTARVHMQKEILEKAQSDVWCYVGKYGENGADRCTIEKNEDGYSFTTENLSARENLTFVIDFDAGTFEVIIEKNYILVILLIIEIAIIAFVLIKKYLRWKKEAREQSKLYRSLFETPQYQPPENKSIHVAEGEQIYLKKTKSSYVATLLELAVSKAVTITKVQDEKKPKKYNWSIHLNVEPATLSPAQVSMLNILANKNNIAKDDDIIIKKHTATKTLAGYAESYRSNAEYILDKEGYLIKKKVPKTKGGTVAAVIAKFFIYGVILFMFLPVFGEVFDEIMYNSTTIVVGIDYIPIVMIILFASTVIINTILTKQIEKYAKYTDEGIKLAVYLEGLELYIKMAEKDRLAFLQSVEGADTTNAGIVKLYEKLLPWASLFGEEESWIKELDKYYQIGDVPEELSSEVLNGIIASNMLRDINNAVNSSISYHEPSSSGGWDSGGGGSSFSSGGGGGGFSGGGRGGGGGGGW